MSDIFELATRRKLRFATSAIGEVTTEQLWDLPLTHKTKVSLDVIAIAVAKDLRDLGDFSFVEAKPDPRKEILALQLDILKHVINVKKAEAAAALDANKKAERKQKILEALEKKEGGELESKSKEELLAELNNL